MFACRQDEGRFRVVRFRRNLLHRLSGQVICIDDNRELVSSVGPFSEYIDDEEAMRHGLLCSVAA
jgi:hypothetical protein